MSVNKLFDSVEQLKEMAHWRAAFGEPQEVEGQTIIPVATVGYGFGLGFGSGPVEVEGEGEDLPAGDAADQAGTAHGAGGGGGAWAKPLGALVVTPEGIYFQETSSSNQVALLGMLAGVLIVSQVAKVLRAIVSRC
jgi:uncharacterized spore protein YtfJ